MTMAMPRRSRVTSAFQDFAQRGVLSGMLLMLTTVLALLWANSPFAASYFHLWEVEVSVELADHRLGATLHDWINDGLMAVFFLLAGLEIKRELIVGELSSPRQAALPIASALGGMLLPALLYSLINLGGDGAGGWGIPMATDIAFALGVLTLLGPRVPTGLKVLLTALAIVDDMGAVVIIALFYTSSIQWSAIALATGILLLLIILNRAHVRALTPYLALGVVLWLALHASGLHATIAGVLLAMAVPTRTRLNAREFSMESRRLLDEFDRSETGDLLVLTSKGQQDAVYAIDHLSSGVQAPLMRLEHALHGAVSYLIMPLFALANAGLAFEGMTDVITDRVALGVAVGLLLGKPAGVMLFSWLAVRLRFAELPAGVVWSDMHGVAWLAGIGFTMSLFVASLAFGDGAMLPAAKVGILTGSVLSGVVGWRILSARNAASPSTES